MLVLFLFSTTAAQFNFDAEIGNFNSGGFFEFNKISENFHKTKGETTPDSVQDILEAVAADGKITQLSSQPPLHPSFPPSPSPPHPSSFPHAQSPSHRLHRPLPPRIQQPSQPFTVFAQIFDKAPSPPVGPSPANHQVHPQFFHPPSYPPPTTFPALPSEDHSNVEKLPTLEDEEDVLFEEVTDHELEVTTPLYKDIKGWLSPEVNVTDEAIGGDGDIKKRSYGGEGGFGGHGDTYGGIYAGDLHGGFGGGEHGGGYGEVHGGGGAYGEVHGGGGGYGEVHGGGGSYGEVHEDDHEGGLVSYGGDSQKVQPKSPGPYGPASPNYKCEKSSETLFVTESSITTDNKCFTVLSVDCQDTYDTGKDIGTRKECSQFTETKCRTVFDTSSEERCSTTYSKQCSMVYETVSDLTYNQKCETKYEQKCHGYGYHQTCEQVPKELCKQVPQTVDSQVPRTKCKNVPEKKCQDFPIQVPRRECREFPKTVCTEDAVQVNKQIPSKSCKAKSSKQCIKIPRQVNVQVPRQIKKKVCSSTKPQHYSAPVAAAGYGK